MRSAKSLAILIVLATCAANGLAQANKSKPKPNLSGTWELDRKRSSVGSSNSSTPPEQITITHHDPELKIRKTVTIKGKKEGRELPYYTEGRGEPNPTT